MRVFKDLFNFTARPWIIVKNSGNKPKGLST